MAVVICALRSSRSLLLYKGFQNLWTSPAYQQVNGSNHDPGSNNEDTDIKKRILTAALPFVKHHGWSKSAIAAGAETIGYEGVVHGLFRNGGVELIQHFYASCNDELISYLKKKCVKVAVSVPREKRMAVIFQDALEKRLCMIIPYLDKWPQAIAIMSLPANVPASLANLLTLVDEISFYAGDRSVDFTWYTQRVALGGIYKATELYLIQDISPEYEETWKFLNRRIQDVMNFQKYFNQSGESSQMALEAITAAFKTARNIFGINVGR